MMIDMLLCIVIGVTVAVVGLTLAEIAHGLMP